MIVSELIKVLCTLPPNAEVLYEGGEYKDDYRSVRRVSEEKNLGWGKSGILIT